MLAQGSPAGAYLRDPPPEHLPPLAFTNGSLVRLLSVTHLCHYYASQHTDSCQGIFEDGVCRLEELNGVECYGKKKF